MAVSASNQNEWIKGRPARKVDNLTAIYEMIV
jgi:hypothetical protein